jgi:spore coat polysaccharide biosynthesis protein SpsF
MKYPKSVILLQARFASRRLPGKAMALVGGRSILARCLDRLRLGLAAPVVLATTTNAEDDTLAGFASSRGVSVFRGPDKDVLQRFVLAAVRVGATYIVRATADNPAVDVDAPGRVLNTIIETGADYVVESGLPYGSGVEAVRVDALTTADAMATSADDREHVTSLIRRDRIFEAITVPAPPELCRPHLRLTVDTLGDLAFMRRVFNDLGNPAAEPPLSAIIDAAQACSSRTEQAG